MEEAKGWTLDDTLSLAQRELQSSDPLKQLEGLALVMDAMMEDLEKRYPCPQGPPWERSRQGKKMATKLPVEDVLVVSFKGAGGNDVLPTLLALYDRLPAIEGPLLRHHVLLCDKTTTHQELIVFAQRAFPPQRQAMTTMYCIVGFPLLCKEGQACLTKAVIEAHAHRHPHTRTYLVFLLPDNASNCQEELRFHRYDLAPLPLPRIKAILGELCPHVLVVSSEEAGVGKTRIIEKDHQQANGANPLVTVTIRDGTTRKGLIHALRKAGLKEGCSLHLDVTVCQHMEEVTLALFELLVLGCLQLSTDIIHLPPSTRLYVEVAHAILPQGGTLRHHLRLLDYFQERKVQWELGDLEVSDSLDSVVQVVCNYLSALERGTLDTHPLIFFGQGQNAWAHSQEECSHLLHRHFFSHLDFIPSLTTLHVFMSVLADQLRKFTHSSWFNPLLNEGVGPQRSTAVRCLVRCSRIFATRSVIHARQRQDHSVHKSSHDGDDGQEEVLPDWMNRGLIKWEEGFPPMLIFDHHGCVLALYRTPAEVDHDIAVLIREQERLHQLPRLVCHG